MRVEAPGVGGGSQTVKDVGTFVARLLSFATQRDGRGERLMRLSTRPQTVRSHASASASAEGSSAEVRSSAAVENAASTSSPTWRAASSGFSCSQYSATVKPADSRPVLTQHPSACAAAIRSAHHLLNRLGVSLVEGAAVQEAALHEDHSLDAVDGRSRVRRDRPRRRACAARG